MSPYYCGFPVFFLIWPASSTFFLPNSLEKCSVECCDQHYHSCNINDTAEIVFWLSEILRLKLPKVFRSVKGLAYDLQFSATKQCDFAALTKTSISGNELSKCIRQLYFHHFSGTISEIMSPYYAIVGHKWNSVVHKTSNVCFLG